MATDPNLLMNLVNAPTLAGQSVFAGVNNALAQAMARQNLQKGQFELGLAQQQQQQQQMYQTDVASFTADPTPQNLMGLIAKYPKQYEALQSGWKLKDQAQRTSDLSFFSDVHGALSKGNTKLAIGALEARLAAEKKAGIDTTQEEQWLEQLRSGEPEAISSIKALALGQIGAAVGPDRFSEAYKTVGEGDAGGKRYVVGRALVDDAGNPLYRDPDPIKYLENREGGYTAVDPTTGQPLGGGGQPSSGGAAPMSGEEVTSAITGAVPGARITSGLRSREKQQQLYDKWVAEGKPRDNPVAKPGTSKHESGQAWDVAPPNGMSLDELAAKTKRAIPNAKILKERGHIHVEVPVGTSRGQSGSGVIGQSAPKAGPARMSPAEVAAEGLDPSIVYYRGPNGIPQAVGGQTRNTAQLKPVPAPVVARVLDNRKAVRNIDEALAEITKYPNGIGFGTGGFGLYDPNRTDPKGTDVRSAIANIGSLIIHDRSGAAVTISETPRLQPFVPLVTDSASTARKKLARLKREIASLNEDYEAQYSEDQGYKPIAQSPSQGGAPQFRILRRRPAR